MSGIQQTRDEIGTEDVIRFIPKRFAEKYNFKQGTFIRETRDVTNDSIWGNGDAWGSDYWQATYINSKVYELVINIDNTFQDSYDLDTFNDDAVTTADLSTAGEINFTSGEIYQSVPIYKNTEASDVTKATLTLTIDSGSFTLYMWTDSNTPETVTNGTEHTFTNSGTSVYYKVVENAASTGKITAVKIVYK